MGSVADNSVVMVVEDVLRSLRCGPEGDSLAEASTAVDQGRPEEQPFLYQVEGFVQCINIEDGGTSRKIAKISISAPSAGKMVDAHC